MVHKLIPLIYFYLLSLIGMVLLIMGVFSTIHYIVGVTAHDKYPLQYGGEDRCAYQIMPPPGPVIEGKPLEADNTTNKDWREQCLKGLEEERQRTKVNDLEKSIAFTLVGLGVFGSHFYFARKKKAD